MQSTKILQAACNTLKLKSTVLAAQKVIVRNSSITLWNKDWKPGPYPRTEEQRLAAAKKYNMIPEDYEPYPEEEGYGDYPKMKRFHVDSLNPHGVFDYQYLKRNYGEPLHPDYDICTEDKVNFQFKFKIPLWKQFLYLFGGVAVYAALVVYAEAVKDELNLVPKQFPHQGQIHYSFEPAELEK